MSDYFSPREDCATIKRATAAFSASLLADVLPDMRIAARGCGYALATHGSQSRDIDLLAVPWTTEASDAETLVAALLGVLNGKLGRCTRPRRKKRGKYVDDWTEKPHGRRACLIYLPGMAPEIDLSIMPRIEEPEE